jgi:hypothetical protein
MNKRRASWRIRGRRGSRQGGQCRALGAHARHGEAAVPEVQLLVRVGIGPRFSAAADGRDGPLSRLRREAAARAEALCVSLPEGQFAKVKSRHGASRVGVRRRPA